MGSTSPLARDRERPVTRVRISRGLWLGKYEVTQAEWQGVMGTNPSGNAGCNRCPVEKVSWNDAQEFIGRLNAMDGAGRYRLPTEAEWEYAARAGTATRRTWARPRGTTRIAGGRTHPVGGKAANAWGLHDMHGNVWERVQDCWNDSYQGAPTDGSVWESGDCSRRVLRGGSWDYRPGDLRAANRHWGYSGLRFVNCGFRVARTLAP